jgi:hypothetical protein
MTFWFLQFFITCKHFCHVAYVVKSAVVAVIAFSTILHFFPTKAIVQYLSGKCVPFPFVHLTQFALGGQHTFS